MAAKLSDSYEIRRANLADHRQQILSLWSLIEGATPPGIEKLEWFYTANPAGPGSAYFLWYKPEDRPVGVVCAGARDFQSEDGRIQGAVFGDLIIEQAHRSLGPGIMLQRESLTLALEDYALVYGFPNPNAAKLCTRAGYPLHDSMVTMVIPLNHAHYVARILPQPLARLLAPVTQRLHELTITVGCRCLRQKWRETQVQRQFVDDVWSRLAPFRQLVGVRDWTYFSWRFNAHPGHAYKTFGIHNDAGEPGGYLVYTIDAQNMIAIVDGLAIDDASFAALIYHFLARMHQRRVVSVALQLQDSEQAAMQLLRKPGFRPRATAHVFWCTGQDATPAADAQPIYLRRADSDM